MIQKMVWGQAINPMITEIPHGYMNDHAKDKSFVDSGRIYNDKCVKYHGQLKYTFYVNKILPQIVA